MKTNALIATVLGTVALSLCSLSVYAEEVTVAGTQVLCPSLHNYEIDPATAGSTYNWGVESGTSGTDWKLSATVGTAVNVDWVKPGTYNFWSQETNQYGCQGPKTVIAVTVSPSPVADNQSNNICSTSQATGAAIDVVTIDLPSAKNGATISKWDITAIDIPVGVTANVGNAGVGEVTDKTAIANDAYTNTTTGALDVVYHVTPYAGECAGPEFTVTITVYPEVKAPTIKF